MNQEKPCRHEYVRIYQRKLKGIDRRLVMTRGFLPVGFKQTDFTHLGEGSYCFCANCRARLYPRRTQAEKLAARVLLAQSKAAELAVIDDLSEVSFDAPVDEVAQTDVVAPLNEASSVSVEELEYESADVEDLEQDAVKLAQDQDDEQDPSPTDQED
jgi:hypothetical protein